MVLSTAVGFIIVCCIWQAFAVKGCGKRLEKGKRVSSVDICLKSPLDIQLEVSSRELDIYRSLDSN